MIAWDKGIREKAVLKPESWKKTFTPAPLKSGKTYPYGFGWFVDEERGQLRHHHGGAWQGFKTYIARYLEDDLTVILLTNLGEAEPDVFTDAIAAAINPKLGLPSQPLKDQEDAIGKRVRTLIARARGNTLTAEDFVVLPAGYFPTLAAHYEKLLAPWVNWRASSSSNATSAATIGGTGGGRGSKRRPSKSRSASRPTTRSPGSI